MELSVDDLMITKYEQQDLKVAVPGPYIYQNRVHHCMYRVSH